MYSVLRSHDTCGVTGVAGPDPLVREGASTSMNASLGSTGGMCSGSGFRILETSNRSATCFIRTHKDGDTH